MQNRDVFVTVEMITYDQEDVIAQALDSVLIQEVDFRYQIVIGEDCSTDSTREILLGYKERYPDKITLVLHDKNVGMRNNSRSVSKRSEQINSKYIALLEGDDYWTDPKKLQIQVDAMENNPDCHLSFHAAEIRHGDDKHGKVVARHADGNGVYKTSEVILGGGGFCPTVSIIYRRDLRTSLPDFYYEVPAGDYLLQILGSLHGGILYVDRVMAVYRKGIEGSWSSFMQDIEKRERFVEDSLKALDDLNLFLEKKYDDEIQQRVANLYYEMSTFYLYAGIHEKFRTYIEMSLDAYRLESKAFLVDYKFRHLPRTLRLLRRVKDLLKSLR